MVRQDGVAELPEEAALDDLNSTNSSPGSLSRARGNPRSLHNGRKSGSERIGLFAISASSGVSTGQMKASSLLPRFRSSPLRMGTSGQLGCLMTPSSTQKTRFLVVSAAVTTNLTVGGLCMFSVCPSCCQ